MASARHLYRATILAPHREMIAARTTDYQAKVAQALRLGPVKDEKPVGPPGLAAFQTNCGACHAIDRKVVGPAMQEVAKIYAGKPDAFITFVKSPTKTRPDFPDMPSMAHVPNSDLRQIADWVQTLNTQPEKKP
jgi:cytochrome c